MNKVLCIAIPAVAFALGSPARGSVILSFEGAVDNDVGFTIGGVAAPFGSTFTLEIGIDEDSGGTGRYVIESARYTLVVGTYTTVTDWSMFGELVALQVGDSITLATDPAFVDPDEHLLVSLINFGVADFLDPLSWGGPTEISGDVIVRGLGGFASDNQLSGAAPYFGTLVLTVIPGPATIGVLLLGVLACGRRRRAEPS